MKQVMDNSRAMAEWKSAVIGYRFLGNGNYIWLGFVLHWIAIAMRSNGSKALNATDQVARTHIGASQVQMLELRPELFWYNHMVGR